MNIENLKTKYHDWSYLGSSAFNLKAKNYSASISAGWQSLKPFFAITDMIVYGFNTVTPPLTDLRLIQKIMDRRPAGYSYVDKTWLVIYTIEWADYLHRVLNVPTSNIWVLCDNQAREDVCLAKGYNVIMLSSISKLKKSEKIILDMTKRTWKKIMKNFDNMVGNPPFDYQGNSDFYIEFIKLANKIVKQGGYFDFVMPNRFLKPNSHAGQATNKVIEATYVMPNVNHYFDIGTEVGVLGGIVTDNPKFNVIPYDFDNGTVINRSLKDTTPLTNICLNSITIVDKVVGSSFAKMKSVAKEENLTNYVYIKRMMERYCPTKPKGGPHRFMTLINQVDNMFGSKVEFSSYDEAVVNEWFMSQSKLGRFLTYCYPAAFGYSTSSLVHTGDMPSLPVTKLSNGNLAIIKNSTQISVVLNDQFFYDLFDLTVEEVKYLEAALLPKKKGK